MHPPVTGLEAVLATTGTWNHPVLTRRMCVQGISSPFRRRARVGARQKPTLCRAAERRHSPARCAGIARCPFKRGIGDLFPAGIHAGQCERPGKILSSGLARCLPLLLVLGLVIDASAMRSISPPMSSSGAREGWSR